MTALTLDPSPRPSPRSLADVVPWLDGRRRQDRRAWIVALGAALLLHFLVLLMRVPPPKLDVPPPRRDPPRIWDTPIAPPEPPAAQQREPRAIDYRLPVPMPSQPPPEPVFEGPPIRPPLAPAAPELLPVEPVPPPLPRVLDEGTAGLELPVPLPGRAEPDYPAPAIRVKVEGRVVIEAVIDEGGRVASARVVAVTRPDLGFSESALAAVSGWRYQPGLYRGRPVAVRLRVEVEFTLR